MICNPEDPKFKNGDIVRMNAHARKQLPRIPVQEWPVVKTEVDSHGCQKVFVKRHNRSGAAYIESWDSSMLELLASSPTVPMFSEAQEIAIKEIVRSEIRKMDAEGYFNHDHKDGEQEPYNEER